MTVKKPASVFLLVFFSVVTLEAQSAPSVFIDAWRASIRYRLHGANGRFWVLPWDTDSTWGPTWNSGPDLVYNGIFLAASHPDLKVEYANAIREVRALLFQPDQINPLIDAFAAQIAGFVPADLRRWSNAPASGGNYVSLSSGAGFTSPALSGGLAGWAHELSRDRTDFQPKHRFCFHQWHHSRARPVFRFGSKRSHAAN